MTNFPRVPHARHLSYRLDAIAIRLAILAAVIALTAFAATARCRDALCRATHMLDDSAAVASVRHRTIRFLLPVRGGRVWVTVRPDGTVHADTAVLH